MLTKHGSKFAKDHRENLCNNKPNQTAKCGHSKEVNRGESSSKYQGLKASHKTAVSARARDLSC